MSRTATGNNDLHSSQPTFVTRKRRKQSPDTNFYIGIKVEEPILKSRRIKIAQGKKNNVKKRSKQSTKTSNWPALNEITSHESPKIWDMFERFQNFTQRRVLTRHKSGLLESCDEDVAKNISQSKTVSQTVPDNNIRKDEPVNRHSIQNSGKTEPPSLYKEDEPSFGGDRKRRCVEVIDYEDELHSSGKLEAQPASAFKPKCLNFDDIDDS